MHVSHMTVIRGHSLANMDEEKLELQIEVEYEPEMNLAVEVTATIDEKKLREEIVVQNGLDISPDDIEFLNTDNICKDYLLGKHRDGNPIDVMIRCKPKYQLPPGFEHLYGHTRGELIYRTKEWLTEWITPDIIDKLESENEYDPKKCQEKLLMLLRDRMLPLNEEQIKELDDLAEFYCLWNGSESVTKAMILYDEMAGWKNEATRLHNALEARGFKVNSATFTNGSNLIRNVEHMLRPEEMHNCRLLFVIVLSEGLTSESDMGCASNHPSINEMLKICGKSLGSAAPMVMIFAGREILPEETVKQDHVGVVLSRQNTLLIINSMTGLCSGGGKIYIDTMTGELINALGDYTFNDLHLCAVRGSLAGLLQSTLKRKLYVPNISD